ncbi:acyl carrier protein [Dyadobacter psychrotolerans]|uniref:Acyl carrier protein n=1 Tax=Dyadobacter psychrotolerans TaxID=2541721 RepID=A0A4R5DF31_9BACT|nr:acyl carrier protein [Dyadobacter psychrotolerans]TDE10481.1 acyl carrier protein [Dyadobacter psychrotolerans]
MNEQLRALLAANAGLPYQSVTDDSHLSKDLGLDSLDTVDIVLQLEDMFQIAIPDEDYQQLQTVRQFSEYLHKRLTAVPNSYSPVNNWLYPAV